MVAPLKERAAAALWIGLVEPLADVSGRLGRLSDEVGQVILFTIFSDAVHAVHAVETTRRSRLGRLLWALNQSGQPTIGRRDAARHQAQRAETAAQRARENTAGVRRQR